MVEAYRTQLDPDRIVATIEQLDRRITERFPDSGLHEVVHAFTQTGRDGMVQVAQLRRPYLWLRLVVLLLIVAAAFILLEEVRQMIGADGPELVQTVDAMLNTLVYLGAAIFFVFTLETRLKRARVLPGLHRLRSVAHIIDMHQLTKDPQRVRRAVATASSPKVHLSEAELGRYYDYCSEALSLVSKVAAVHAQHFNDAVVLTAVDEVEMLCTGLSRKIWQKIMLLRSEMAPSL